MQLIICSRWLLLISVICAAPFFFIGGPSQYSLEIYRRIWDFGHPVFFAVVSVLSISFGLIKNTNHFRFGLLMVLVASLVIETLQSLVGRQASALDVLLNLSGFLAGGIFLPLTHRQKYLLILAVLLGLLPGLIKLFKSAMVTWILWSQFPVLLSGESIWEKHAWGSEIKLQPVEQQGYLLQFNGRVYASADLMGFIQSWKNYQSLTLEVENPDPEPFMLTLRISDKQHEYSGRAYGDRFNRQLLIQPGKQKIIVDMKDIEAAPVNRKMNLDQIYLFKLFLSKEDKPRRFLLDKMYLERKTGSQ